MFNVRFQTGRENAEFSDIIKCDEVPEYGDQVLLNKPHTADYESGNRAYFVESARVVFERIKRNEMTKVYKVRLHAGNNGAVYKVG